MDIRNLGNFANIEAVWASYPNGGIEGDYLFIPNEQGVKYRWNKYIQKWENAAVVTETTGRQAFTVSDLQVQHEVHVGSHADVHGDLRVRGVLRARHVKQPNVGLFATLAALQSAYPNPEVGMWAIVGDSVPGYVYRCETAGTWEATGETGGVDELENVVLYGEQSLTEAEKKQARANLGMGNGDFATGSDFDTPDSTKRAKVVTVGAVLDGADAVPTFGSEKHVKSGGIRDCIDNAVYNKEVVNSLSFEQTTNNSGYQPFALQRGKTYILSIQLNHAGNDIIDHLTGINIYPQMAASSVLSDLLPLFGGKEALKNNNTAKIEYTVPFEFSADVQFIAVGFQTGFVPQPGNSIVILAEILSEKYATIVGDGTVETELKNNGNLVTGRAVFEKLFTEIVFSSVQYSQTKYQTDNQYLSMLKGVKYLLTLQFEGEDVTSKLNNFTDLQVFHGSQQIDSISKADWGEGLLTNYEASIYYTPSEDVTAIRTRFNSAQTFSGDNRVVVKATITKDNYLTNKDFLGSKTVLMLGDSITQLPNTSNRTGLGIVEYFAAITGAKVIRGAFGGSHIRSRRDVSNITTPSDLNDSVHAIAFFDIVNIVKSLCSGDFTMQEAAYQYNLDNNLGWDTYWPTIIGSLKNLDMSTVDYITIFAGTNDYNNSVPIEDSYEDNVTYEFPAWNDILRRISLTFPKINVFIFTPIVRMDNVNGEFVWCEDHANSRGLHLSDYVESNINAAKRFMFPYCDLYHGMGWNQHNFWQYFESNDGVHPRKGFQEIAKKMATFIISNENRA